MRLWSLAPQYLDSKGLNGVWREGLLAQAVLLGRTKGWTNHSHLLRFKNHLQPVYAIGYYLLQILEEGRNRGYSYDKCKIVKAVKKVNLITVTEGQLRFEWQLLSSRLKHRAPQVYHKVIKRAQSETHPKPHPLFVVIKGVVESWEKSYWRENEKPYVDI